MIYDPVYGRTSTLGCWWSYLIWFSNGLLVLGSICGSSRGFGSPDQGPAHSSQVYGGVAADFPDYDESILAQRVRSCPGVHQRNWRHRAPETRNHPGWIEVINYTHSGRMKIEDDDLFHFSICQNFSFLSVFPMSKCHCFVKLVRRQKKALFNVTFCWSWLLYTVLDLSRGVGGLTPTLVPLNSPSLYWPPKNTQNKSKIHCWPPSGFPTNRVLVIYIDNLL